MNRDSKEFQAFMRVHAGLLRQGPGSDDATLHALELLPPIPKKARIYDLGCGPGCASIILANKLQQKIIAVDLSEDFLRQLNDNTVKYGDVDLIETRCGDMMELSEHPETIDLIWTEGAIFIPGFDNALAHWRPMLKKKGLIACTELSWLTTERSNAATMFWKTNYPAMRSVKENIAAAEKLGYTCLNHFTLPESCWWNKYYHPLLQNIERLEEEAAKDEILSNAISNTKAEIELFRYHHHEYGYVFYLLQKS
jgi:serine/threonine-protein kinase HipA